jgi:hypothetical protein
MIWYEAYQKFGKENNLTTNAEIIAIFYIITMYDFYGYLAFKIKNF